jgi:hypothetical protein
MRLSYGSGVARLGRGVECAAILLTALVLGCASPGPPHAPSLYLPKPPNDLAARRVANRVELRFTAPMRSSDNLPLKAASIHVSLCRQLDHEKTCTAVPAAAHDVAPSKPNAPNAVSLEDALPAELTHGPARLIGYRVEIFNASGQSAGKSEPAYTAAGDAPPPVGALRAEGSRLGVLLQWTPAPATAGEVVVEREDLSKAPAQKASKHGNSTPANVVQLAVESAGSSPDRVLDTTAKSEVAYRYTAERQLTVQIGGRSLELRSEPSPPVPFVLHLAYAPLAPTGLTAAGFTTPATSTAAEAYLVDLIWQPVEDTGLLAGLAGYNVYRQALDPNGNPVGNRARLNESAVPVPAFHDATASASQRYRYSVTAVDGKGNESPAVTVVLEAETRP